MWNLFRACLYLEEDILNQNRFKEARPKKKKMSDVTDIPLLIRQYCIKKKKKRQESNWPLSRLYSRISGVFCSARDTDLWRNIMHN